MNKTIAICDLCEMECQRGGLPARSFALPGGVVHVCGPCQEDSHPVRRLLDVIKAILLAHPIYHQRGTDVIGRLQDVEGPTSARPER